MNTVLYGARPKTDVIDPRSETMAQSTERAERAGASPLPRRPAPSAVGRDMVLARVRERLIGESEPARVDRFVVVERIGQGAMGVVYSAYDPKLDRKVALKLVLPGYGGSEGDALTARLEREAQAAANLSHPNVVAVYDVGSHHGGVFLAMEYVEGETLAGWLGSARRTWRQTIEMFIACGRGLEAAHRSGIVHRDFKPDNVLVGSDGRPRVADFGLARPTEGWSAKDAEAIAGRGGTALRTAAEGATTGEVAGTPAYMAPEQFLGVDVGPHSDLFGFCVALYEGLFGSRPFHGQSVTELAAAVMEGAVRPPPRAHPVPRSVVALVMQGMRPDPSARPLSMTHLLRGLESALHRRRRMLTYGISGAASVLALAGGFQLSEAAAVDPCADTERALGTAWDSARQESISAKMAGLEAGERFLKAASEYADDWQAKHREVCEATRVEGSQSDFAMQLRMSCLERMRTRFGALTGEVTRATDGALGPTPDLQAVLGRLSTCDDVEQLGRLRNATSSVSKFEDQAQQDAWIEGEDLLVRGQTRLAMREPGAYELLQAAVALGENHELPMLTARGLRSLAEAELRRGEVEQAQTHLARALPLAVAGELPEEVSWIELFRADVAMQRGDLAAAKLHVAYAEAFATVPTHGEVSLAAAQATRARIALNEGDYAAAQELFESLLSRDDLPASVEAAARVNVGVTYYKLGKLEAALESYRQAVQRARTPSGEEHVDIGGVQSNIGRVLTRLHRYDDAEAHLTEALQLVRSKMGADHPYVASVMLRLAKVERGRGNPDGAAKWVDQALAHRARIEAPDDPSLASMFEERGYLARLAGDYDSAFEHLNRAGNMRDRIQGDKDHPSIAFTLTEVGEVFLAQDRLETAVGPLREAMRVRSRDDVDSEYRGDTEFALARALRESKPEESRELAEAARRHFTAAGEHTKAKRELLAAFEATLPSA